MHCALFAHKGGSFGIRELRQSDSNTTVREMKLGGTVVISLILCFVSRNKAQVSLIFFSFFRVYTDIIGICHLPFGDCFNFKKMLPSMPN